MGSKKGSVKWEIPEVKESRTQRRSQKDQESERLYSDKLEDNTNVYSDTFLTESYSDTFVSSSQEPVNSSVNGSFRFTRDRNSLTHSGTELQTMLTDGIPTVIEVESESEFPGTAIDTELQTTLVETVREVSDIHPTDSYSDTFESADRTRTDLELRSAADSQRSYSATFTQSSRTLDSADLDHSYIAPEYDGKSLTDDEYTDDTDHDDYSDTFEPTEHTTQLSEQVSREQTFERHDHQAQQRFIDKMIGKFRDRDLVKVRGLQVISPEPGEESEDECLKHYCKKRVKQLKKRGINSRTEKSLITEGDKQPATVRAFEGEKLSDYGLQDCILERAKLTNVMSAMKKAARSKIHEVKNCQHCSELKSRLEEEEAEKMFTESRARMLKSKMMDLHVENHILKMNSISMIADLARGLPRSSERPEKIMDQLLEPLLGKNVMR